MRTSRVGLVGVVVVVATVIAACGSTSTQTVQSSGANMARLVKAAAAKSAGTSAMKGELSATLDGEQILDIEFSGTTDGSVAEGRTEITGSSDIKYIAVGGNYYYAYPNLPPGKSWVQLSAADLQSLGIDIKAAQAQSGTEAFTFLSGASNDTKRIGTENIDGRQTTHYLFHVNLGQLAAKQGVMSQKLIDQVTGLLGPNAPMDVWIDGDGRVARLVYGADLAKAPNPPAGLPKKGKLTYEFNLSDYGAAPTVTVPPAGSVLSYADYKAQASSSGN